MVCNFTKYAKKDTAIFSWPLGLLTLQETSCPIMRCPLWKSPHGEKLRSPINDQQQPQQWLCEWVTVHKGKDWGLQSTTSNNHSNGYMRESQSTRGKTEASNQQPATTITMVLWVSHRETDPPASSKFADDCSPRWYLNCNFIKESESAKLLLILNLQDLYDKNAYFLFVCFFKGTKFWDILLSLINK